MDISAPPLEGLGFRAQLLWHPSVAVVSKLFERVRIRLRGRLTGAEFFGGTTLRIFSTRSIPSSVVPNGDSQSHTCYNKYSKDTSCLEQLRIGRTALWHRNEFSLSQKLEVSTYSLLYYRDIDIYCQKWDVSIGRDICIPPRCKTHTWQTLDTCNGITLNYGGMNVPQLISWNANFHNLCQNSVYFTSYEICVR